MSMRDVLVWGWAWGAWWVQLGFVARIDPGCRVCTRACACAWVEWRRGVGAMEEISEGVRIRSVKSMLSVQIWECWQS